MDPEALAELILELARHVAPGELPLADATGRLSGDYPLEVRQAALSLLWRHLTQLRAEDRDAYPLGALTFRLSQPLRTPEAAGVAYWFGLLCCDTGRFEEAVAPLETALLTCFHLGRTTDAVIMMGLLGRAWLGLGQPEPATNYFEMAYRLARHGEGSEVSLALLQVWARAEAEQGRLGEAVERFERLVEESRRARRHDTEFSALLDLQSVYGRLRDGDRMSEVVRRAVRAGELALRQARERGDARSEAEVLLRVGQAYGHLNLDYMDRAIASLHRAADAFSRFQDREGQARALQSLASLYRRLGQLPEARQALQEWLDLPTEQAAGGRPRVLLELASVNESLGERQRAESQYQEVLSWSRQANRPAEARNAHLALGRLYERSGRFRPCIEHYESALELNEAAGDALTSSLCHLGLGMAWFFLGESDAALGHLRRAVEFSRAARDRAATVRCLTSLGQVCTATDMRDEAEQYYREALDVDPGFEEAREGLDLARHARVEFPVKCVRGQTALLKMQFSLADSSSRDPVPSGEVGSGEAEAILTVLANSDAFRVVGLANYDDWPQAALSDAGPQKGNEAIPGGSIRLGQGEWSQVLVFALLPRDDIPYGAYEIVIDCFNGGQWVGNLLVQTTVSNPTMKGTALVRGHRPKRARRTPGSLPRLPRRVAVMAQSCGDAARPSYKYFLTDDAYPGELINGGQTGSRISQKDSLAVLRAVIEQLDLVAELELPMDEYKSVENTIAGLGRALWQQLPELLRDFVGGLPDGTVIQIKGEELEWVPWELVSDGTTLWGERFVLSRLPLLMPGEVRAEEVGVDYGVHFVASNLSSNASQARTWEARALDLFRWSGKVRAVSDALPLALKTETKARSRGNCIIHFTCHGDSPDGGLPYLLLGPDRATRKLLTTSVDDLDLRTCGLIFANACKSQSAAAFLSGFVSFGKVFTLGARAEAFIGTLCFIPVELALEFAEVFYAGLQEGESIGEALRQTRLEFKRRNNVFWMCYCSYGNAGLRLKF
jgi:tetratricopeptide (TPR) repeat protein